MRKYRLTIVFALAAIVFTIIATLMVNRVLISVLFLILLAFIAVADVTIQRSRRREIALIEAQLKDREEAEQELTERAIALQVANTELEAFSYSVSHDLRSPLRSIDGFSQALLEDFKEQLDDTGKDYLGRIRAASQRMGQLIDDLLQLSRLARKEMQRDNVDLSGMAESIGAELKQSHPDRQGEFVVGDGLLAYGDAKLLHVMLENLLSNAWKFTSKKPHACIEFNVTHNNGASVYFVKDNGAGFDMDYVDKLFGAFQRLHGTNEFEGTGIGLANVQRIVRRHGGDVWAEGMVDQGATFYFTLRPHLEKNHEHQEHLVG